MPITYQALAKHQKHFLQLTGITVEHFNQIIKATRPIWKEIENKKKCMGRTCKIKTLEDKVLCVLIYYRTYVSHMFLSYLFDIDNSNICRLFKRIEPILAKRIMK